MKILFFNTILVFTPGLDYKYCNECISQKIVNLSITNKMHLKCDVIDDPVVNGLKHLIFYKFVLDKKLSCKVFCAPETVLFKKINKNDLNTITVYLEDDNHKEVDFNGETLTLTLQMNEI